LPEYTELIPDDTTALAIESEAYEYIQSMVSEWEPSDGDPTVWIIKTFSGVISQLFEVVADVSDEIFAEFGQNLMGIRRREATPAVAESTWTMVDDAGYTIPGGISVRLPVGDDSVLFLTTMDVDVLPGSTTASVPLVAEEAGVRGNGLSGSPALVDALSFVETIQIELEDATSGGSDEETMDEYKPRLRELLQLMSPRPITPEHFEVLARQETGVFRAVAIPGLDPGPPATYDNALTMTIAVMNELGDALTLGAPDLPGTRQYVKAALEKNVPINSVIHVVNADYTEIDVTAEIASLPEYDHAAVLSAVDSQLKTYFAPINWGRRAGWGMVPTSWVNTKKVRFYEVVEVINRAVGVDYIVDLQIGKHSDGPSGMDTIDLDLDGHVTLTRPKDLVLS